MQLAAVHGKAIRSSPGIRLQRPLAAPNGAQQRGSVLGHSPDTLIHGHIYDGSTTAELVFGGAVEAVLEARENKTEIELGLTTSDVDKEVTPLPPVTFLQRPRPVSSRARGRNSDSDEHLIGTHGPAWC